MTIRISKKGLVIFAVILAAGFLFLGKTENNNTQNSDLTLPGQVREITVTAQQFSFNPNPIRVKLGETIRLKITSIDVTHGFSLPEFNINEILEPGKTVTVEFQVTRQGNFQFFCSIACGVDHSRMRGTLIVE